MRSSLEPGSTPATSATCPTAGNYITAHAGDQPVLVLRGDDGKLRAFRNVCRHRGSELLTGSGRCKKAIRCRYHGWTYDATDGRLLGVPEHREYGERLDKSASGLIPARSRRSPGCCSSTSTATPRRWPRRRPGSPSVWRRTGFPSSPSSRARRAGGGHRPSPRTGRSWSRTTSRATTCRSPIPGLMWMLDYKGYRAELHDGWTWFDAPLRDEPREPARAPLPAPRPADAGALGGGEPQLVLRLRLSEHRDRPLPGPGQRLADPACRSRADGRQLVLLSRSRFGPDGPAGAADQQQVQQLGARRGHRPGRARSRRVPARVAMRPDPLAAKEAAVGWFADRVRAALGEAGTGR